MYLLDSDAAKKLAQYNLLNDLAMAFNCDLSDFAVLPQLKFQLKLHDPAAALKKLGSENAVIAAQNLIAAAEEVTLTIESANPFLALDRPDIDAGEQVLFASLYEKSEDDLISGDKRAYIALSKIEEFSEIDTLWSRLICLEEAIYQIITTQTFPPLSEKIRARPDVDISLSIIFGRSVSNSFETVIAGLSSYLRNLVVESGGKYVLPSNILALSAHTSNVVEP